MKKLILSTLFALIATFSFAQGVWDYTGPVSGTNTYTINVLTPTFPTSYTGTALRLHFPNGNTGASTLNVSRSGSPLGAVAIRKWDGDSWEALVSGDIPAGSDGILTYYSSGGYFKAVIFENIGSGTGASDLQSVLDAGSTEVFASGQFTVGSTVGLKLDYDDGTNAFSADATGTKIVANSATYTWPTGGQSSGEVLTTNGSGTLTWEPKAATTDIVGTQDLFISAAAMWPRTTGGCADLAKTEVSTSLFNIQSLDFDQSTDEHAQFQVVLPRKWNNSTVTVVVYWTTSASSGDVIWGIQGGAYSNDDALSTAFGTAQTTTDTFIAANDVHVTSATSAITLAGTPADADFLAFQIYRDADNGSDTLNGDAKLLGISIRITTDAAKDN